MCKKITIITTRDVVQLYDASGQHLNEQFERLDLKNTALSRLWYEKSNDYDFVIHPDEYSVYPGFNRKNINSATIIEYLRQQKFVETEKSQIFNKFLYSLLGENKPKLAAYQYLYKCKNSSTYLYGTYDEMATFFFKVSGKSSPEDSYISFLNSLIETVKNVEKIEDDVPAITIIAHNGDWWGDTMDFRRRDDFEKVCLSKWGNLRSQLKEFRVYSFSHDYQNVFYRDVLSPFFNSPETEGFESFSWDSLIISPNNVNYLEFFEQNTYRRENIVNEFFKYILDEIECPEYLGKVISLASKIENCDDWLWTISQRFRDNKRKGTYRNFVFPILIYTKSIGNFIYQYCNDARKGRENSPVVIITASEPNKEVKERFSLLFNSMIWFRHVSLDRFDEDGYSNYISRMIREMFFFKELGLYDISSTQEYIDYQLRISSNNYLRGNHRGVTPSLFGSEDRDYLDQRQNKRFYGQFQDVCKINDSGDGEADKVKLRILMIDDHIGERCLKEEKGLPESERWCNLSGERQEISFKSCENISNCSHEQCRLYVVRKLLERADDFIDDRYYTRNVRSWFCPLSVPAPKKGNQVLFGRMNNRLSPWLNIKFENENKSSDFIEIIAVKDVRAALIYMYKYRVDFIFLDYLLGEKSEEDKEREYSVQLFQELEYNGLDNEFIRTVRTNRGPLNKFWIMPISAFSDTFFDHLKKEGINSIGRYWHVCSGADLLNTPVQFLYELNQFIELQLKGCIYNVEKLIEYLEFTGRELDSLKKKSDFEYFQAFMGAEYSEFMQRFGARLIIEKDRKDDDKTSGSIFSKYVWEHFYCNEINKEAIEFNYLLRHFYHTSAHCINDFNGLKKLKEAFGDIEYFLNTTPDYKLLKNCDTKKMIRNFVSVISSFDCK